MKTNKYYIFSLILAALTIFSSNAWSTDAIWTISGVGSNGQTQQTQTLSTSSVSPNTLTGTWTAYSSTSYYGGGSGGAQLGSGSTQFNGTITLSNTNIPSTATITGIEVGCYTKNAGTYTLSAKVANTNFGTSGTTTKSDGAAKVAFTGSQVGNTIEITASTSTNAYLMVKSIKVTYETTTPSSVATPTFSPAGGTYTSAQSVTISCSTGGTTIYYTTDNSTPTSTSTQYTGAISVGSSQTIKAIAIKGAASSNVGAATYTINIPATVSFSTGENNPGVDPETEENKGDGITLPAGPTPACSAAGWVFAGWATAEVSNVTAAPRLYMPGDEYIPDGNETLYAVYRKLTGGTSTAIFTSTDLTNLTQLSTGTSGPAWWIHTATGVEFYIKSWGIYNQSGNKFDIFNSWALIDAHTKIQQVVFSIYNNSTITSVDLNAEEEAAGGTAKLTGTSTQTITCTGDVTQLYLRRPSGDSYFTTFTVTYYNTKFESNPSCEPCTATPAVGAASLEGDFSLSSVGVKCASAAASPNNDDCGLTEYGFVWGTSNEDGHPNKNDNVLTNAGEYSANYTNTITNVSADVTYYYRGYAKNNGDNYGYSSAIQSFTPRTVNYNKNANDATGSNPAQQVVITGGTVTLPAANVYSWTGHTLVKWATGSAEGTQYNPSATSPAINASTTFYAIWETNKHKFAWNFNGGSSTETAGEDYTAANDEMPFGTEIDYPANGSMERTGYTFGSWSSSATTMPDNALTITANWNTVNYTITYNTNGGAAIAVGNYNIETATFSLPTPSKDGYTFAGWKTNSELTGESVSSIVVGTTGNKEYWAAWTPNTYKVKFNANGGTGSMSDQDFTYDADAVALTANAFGAPTDSHKYFNGWATSESRANAGIVDYADKAAVQNLTKTANGTFNLYAVWVAYNYKNYRTLCCTPLGAIGGTVALSQSGNNIVVNGWSATTGGNENGYLVRLYNSDKSNVISYANTGSKDIKSHTFTNPGAGTYWVSVSPTYEGEGTFCDAGDETFSATSITLTGQVNITFKKNGATGTDDQIQAVDYDTETALEDVSERGYTAPDCKEFGGWASSEDNAAAGNVAYANGANITATEPVTLWAIWNTKTFAISDGTIDDASVASYSYSVNTIDCGETLTITCAPTNAYKGNPTVTATGSHGAITIVSATEVTIANVQSAMAVSIAYETAKENYEVTWNVNGAETKKSFVEGTTYATIMADASKPSVAHDAVSANCDADKFMGWATALIDKDNATSSDVSWYNEATILSGKQTFYAVWAKESTSQGSPVTILNEPFTNLSGCPTAPGSAATKLTNDMSYTCNPNNTSSNTRIMTNGGPSGGSTGNNIIIQNSNGYFRISNIPSDGQTSLTLVYREYGSGTMNISTTETGVTIGTATADGTLRTLSISIPTNTESFDLKFKNTHNSNNLRIDDINISYTPSVTTYSNYITECCIPAATVSGKIAISNVSEYAAKATWSWSGATAGLKTTTLNVYKNGNATPVQTINLTPATATEKLFNDLKACEEYYCTITTTTNTGYCDGAADQGTSDHFTTSAWNVKLDGLSHVNMVEGETSACATAHYEATFAAESGYLLPETITVIINSDEKTVGVDYTWDHTTGELLILKTAITEEVEITIEGVERPSYAVTIVNPTHGTITVMNGESAVSSGNNVKGGSVLTLSGTGNTAAYRVVDFSAYKTGDQSTAVDITSNTLTMPDYAITITAEEIELFPVYVSVNDANMGTAQIGIEELVAVGAGPVYIEDQDVLLLEATPNDGYAFVNWTANGTADIAEATDASTTAMVGATRTFTANFQPIVATPTFTNATGTYYDNAMVELSCATAGATIRYTLDNSEPTSTSDVYDEPFAVSSTTTVKAKAFKAGCKESATASATYTIGYTVKWSVNNNDAYNIGVTDANSKVASGGTVSVPTAPADNLISGCANKFMGWSKKNFTFEEGKDADDYNDLFTETSPAITAPTTFYAVFATQDGSPEGFTLVSTASNFTDGKYVAACLSYNTYYFVDGTTGTNGIGVETTGLASASVTEGSFLLSALPSGAVIMDIEDNGTPSGDDHYYYLAYTSGNTTKYLDDNGTGSSLNWSTTRVNAYHPNFTQKTTNGCVLLSSSGSKVSQNGSSKDDFIRNYASTSNYFNDIYFFKKTGNGYTYSNYVTMCDNTKAYVTYDLDGGSVEGDACASGKYTKEGFKTCATEPTKTGYDFAGWNDGTSTYAANADYTLTDDITFTAQWTAKNYTIVYEVNGGTAKDNESYTIEAAYELTPATKGHEQFVGWHIDPELNDEVVTTIPAGQTGTKTFYAEWAPRYEITFVNDGVTVGSIWRAANENLDAEVAGEDAIPALTAPSSCSTKVFAGWLEEEIEENEVDEAPAGLIPSNAFAVSEAKTFYAVWKTRHDDPATVKVFEDDMSTYAAKADNQNPFIATDPWHGTYVYGTNSSTNGVKLSSKNNNGTMKLGVENLGLASTAILTFNLKLSNSDASSLTITRHGEGSTATFTPSSFTCEEDWTLCTCTITNINAATDSIVFSATKRLLIKDVIITQMGIVTTYDEYSTSCCTKGEIIGASKEGVVLSGGTLTSTYNRCCAGREVVVTASNINDGYIFNSWVVKVGDDAVEGTTSTDGAGNPTFTFTMPDGNVNVSALFAIDASDYVVETDDELVIDAPTVMANLTVEAGGEVEIEEGASLTVNNLTIESEAGKSGQVMGTSVQVNGDIYLEIKLDKSGTMDPHKYYCISAPFDVAALEWGNGTPMLFNVDYQLFIYDGDKRARTGNGWQRVGGTMQKNSAYFIGFDDENTKNQNIIRLKAANKAIPTATSIALEEHSATYGQDESEIAKNSNWNGLGNPRLNYVNLNKNVSVYEAEEERFDTYLEESDNGFVVGTAFFVQGTGDLTFENEAHGAYRAPKRENEHYMYCVEIAQENASRYDNRLYVMASETASTSFEEGKDLPTLNSETSKYGALIWTKNYGMRLVIEETPMVNNKASYELGIFAPADGAYRIETPTENESADLYLTYNGRAIWNLSMGTYEAELTKGQNEGYGLLLVKKMPMTPTGIDEPTSNSSLKGRATKVVIDEHVYILRGGQMYDVTGKAVK